MGSIEVDGLNKSASDESAYLIVAYVHRRSWLFMFGGLTPVLSPYGERQLAKKLF